MNKHVVTGTIWCISWCHPTITNSYRCQMFLLIHFEIKELWVIITTNTRTQPARKFPGDFANFQKISMISRRKNNSRRFPGVLRHPDIFMQTYFRFGFNQTIVWQFAGMLKLIRQNILHNTTSKIIMNSCIAEQTSLPVSNIFIS